jgi:hypothetical protein
MTTPAKPKKKQTGTSSSGQAQGSPTIMENPSGGSGSSILIAGLNLQDIAKQLKINIPGLPTTLLYDGVAPQTGQDFFKAINELSYKYGQQGLDLANAIATKAGFQSARNAGKTNTNFYTNIASALAAANGNFNALQTATAYTTTAAYEADQNAFNMEIKAQEIGGISSATASQQANAIDNAYATIDTWYNGSSAQMENVKAFLGKVVASAVTLNGDHIVNKNALMDMLRGEAQPPGMSDAEFKEIQRDYDMAFPGLRAYNADNSSVHMSETQYQTYSSTIMNSATQFGVPMPSQAQIGELLNNHVSASEYTQRVTDIGAAVQNADQTTKNLLASQYGITESNLVNYLITGNLPAMQRQVAASEIQDYASRVGMTGLSQGQSQQLGEMARLSATAGNQALGYGVSNIENSLLTASRDTELTKALPGANRPTVSTTQLIGSQLAGFGGTNQAAEQVEVGRAEQAAAAPFNKGGGYEENQKGVIGIGSART